MDIYTIGRKNVDIVIEDTEKTVSKHHAELTISDDGRNYYLVDCASSNGTFVQRKGQWERIKQDAIKLDDVVKFGSSKVRMKELLNRLPQRGKPQSSTVEPPSNRTVLEPWRNPDTGEVEYRAKY
jgi:pSer/pThr/pTyr-binding forkhead associated (FHA) protein